MSTPYRSPLCLALLAPLGVACGEEERPPPAATPNDERKCRGAGEAVDLEDEEAPAVECPQGEEALLCFGAWAAHCTADGDLEKLDNCRLSGEVCVSQKCPGGEPCDGCRACAPDQVRCEPGGELHRCKADSSGFELDEICDEAAGERCNTRSGQCEDLCAAAARARSYIGCEYWAVATSNSQLAFDGADAEGLCRPFSFAVVIANSQGVDAHVTIDSPGFGQREITVTPGEARSVELPCDPALKNEIGAYASVKRADGAHRIRSDAPVTVYQFNPLEFEYEGGSGQLPDYSHTNDASLLLPTHALDGTYRIMTQPTLLHELEPRDDPSATVRRSGPGFIALVGVEADPVQVEIISSAHTRASLDGEIPALAPGDTLTLSLAQGEVLQLVSEAPANCDGAGSDELAEGRVTYCRVGKEYDLTGTRVRAGGKVSVISGHDCAFLPFNRWACDHVEETMFPVESWGKEILVSMSEGVACQPPVPNLVRVLSDSDEARVRTVPDVHAPVVLDAGEYVDFEIDQDVHIAASGAILVGQFLLGQDYEGRGSSGSRGKGDPAFSLGIPLEQWRKDYSFLAPSTFTDNFVNVIARDGQVVLLDGGVVTGFRSIEGTDLATARVQVEGGEHRLESLANVGIVVYGYAVYTSYMVPGGLDLNPINRPD